MRSCVLLLASAVVATACGHAAKLRPTAPGAIAVEGTLGGPMAEVEGLTLPLPLSTVGVSVGLTKDLDLGVHAHLTSLAFGVAGIDVGTTYLALEGAGVIPTVALNGKLYGFLEVARGTPAGYLELGGTASWKLGTVSPYLHLAGMAQLSGPVLPAFGAGLQVELGRFALQGEVRWFQPFYPTEYVVVEWLHVGGRGSWGPVLSLSYRFGGEG